MTPPFCFVKISLPKPKTRVIEMGRTFVAASWLNADENDYSGSQQSHMVGRMANIAAYADPEPVKKANNVKKPDLRTKEQAREDFLDRKRVAFEKAFENGQISFEQYDLLLTEWEKSMARLEKRMGIVKEEPTSPTPSTKPSIMNAVEYAAKGFAARHPFAFLVASIMVGAGILNVFGFGV